MIKYYFFSLFFLCFLQSSAFSQNIGDTTEKICSVQSYQYYNQKCSQLSQCLWEKYVKSYSYKCPEGYNKSSYLDSKGNLIVECYLGNETVPPEVISWTHWEPQSELIYEFVSKEMCIGYGYNPGLETPSCPNVKVKINAYPYKTGTVKLKCNNN